MTKEEKELEIQHAMVHLSDLIPYDDPEYDEKLRRMAEAAVRPWDDEMIEQSKELLAKIKDRE